MSDNAFEQILKRDTELIYDKYFYQRIYKRTERLLGAVSFITDKIYSKTVENDYIGDNIKATITIILKDITELLEKDKMEARVSLRTLSADLIHLTSSLNILTARGRLEESHAGLIMHEIDAVISDIASFRESTGAGTLANRRATKKADRGAQSAYYGGGIARESGGTTPEIDTLIREKEPDRKERIKTILRDKGQSGIKDISDVIKDVSEKSIQRDLNDLIASGEVVREGERRWSTYRIV